MWKVYILSAIAVACPVGANTEILEESFEASLSNLAKHEYELIKDEGREAVIDRYRDLLEVYASHPRAIEVEMRIAHLYVGATEDPDSRRKASNAYESIYQRYSKEHPLTKRAGLLAADRILNLDPAKGSQMYGGLIAQYPDDDHLRLTAYESLAQQAVWDGHFKEAEELYAMVLMYDPPPDIQRADEIGRIQHNSAVGMFYVFVDVGEDPLVQLAQLDNLIAKYPTVQWKSGDLVARHSVELHNRIKNDLLAEAPSIHGGTHQESSSLRSTTEPGNSLEQFIQRQREATRTHKAATGKDIAESDQQLPTPVAGQLAVPDPLLFVGLFFVGIAAAMGFWFLRR